MGKSSLGIFMHMYHACKYVDKITYDIQKIQSYDPVRKRPSGVNRDYTGYPLQVNKKHITGRNCACICGSGKKYKYCCINKVGE